MKKLLKYLFWVSYYCFLPTPRSLEGYLIRGMRKRWPWKKFKPCVYHNDDGGFWQIWLSNDRGYTSADKALVGVDLHFSMETGKVVGFNVYDERLADLTVQEE